MTLPIDAEYQLTLQGFNDAGPGSINSSPTALPLIAHSRALLQGENESNSHFAARLVLWRNSTWTGTTQQIGKTERLAEQLHEFIIEGRPKVTIIERIYSTSGPPQAQYTSCNADGSFSGPVTANFDWDSISGDEDDQQNFTPLESRESWSDFWIVITLSPYPRGATVTPLTGMEIFLALPQRDLANRRAVEGAAYVLSRHHLLLQREPLRSRQSELPRQPRWPLREMGKGRRCRQSGSRPQHRGLSVHDPPKG